METTRKKYNYFQEINQINWIKKKYKDLIVVKKIIIEYDLSVNIVNIIYSFLINIKIF